LVTWRVAQGVGAALLLPGGLAVLAAAYPDPVRRRRAVGTWAAAGALALVAGPVAGGFLVAAHGWPSVFWVNVPLCVLVAVVVAATPSVPAQQRRLDLPGALLTCAVLGLSTYAVVLAGRGGWTLGTSGSLAVALGALAALVAVERRRPDPLLPGFLRRWARSRHRWRSSCCWCSSACSCN
jgi:DHA2 family methylenomycin A resistance protein-like MFS transporter